MVQMVVPPQLHPSPYLSVYLIKSSHFVLPLSLPPLWIFILFLGYNLLQPLFILILKLLHIWPVGSL